MKLDLGDEPIEEILEGKVEEAKQSSSILIRKIHTIHEMTVYPNGQMYLKKIDSWLDKKVYAKKDKVDDTVQPTQIKKQEEEIY